MAEPDAEEECPAKPPVKKEREADGQAKALPECEDVWAKDHYCFQVAFIDEVVKPPWRRCFGGLGTGFVGVRPADSPAVKLEPRPDAGTAPPRPAASGEEGGHTTSHSSSDSAAPLPSDASVVIFINAPGRGLQQRGGRTIDGYQDALDRHERTLEWSAQRSDKHNKRIETIVAHCNRGGRVVVGVRGPNKKAFRLLGEVSHIDALHRARFLVEHGDHVIQERGTRTFHKTITVACLNMGLRSGVGLSALRYPFEGKARWCHSCCYSPPKAVLHFKEMSHEGVAAYHTKAGRAAKQERIAKSMLEADEATLEAGEAKLEVDSPTESRPIPLKRLRCKQSLTKEERPPDVLIKTEVMDQERPSSVLIKTELVDEEVSASVLKTEEQEQEQQQQQEETPASIFIKTEEEEKAAIVRRKIVIKTEQLTTDEEAPDTWRRSVLTPKKEHVSTAYLQTFGFQLLDAA